MAGSFSSLLHRVSHNLQNAFSEVEAVAVHHHGHEHSHAHHHADHTHPLLDLLKDVSQQSDAPSTPKDVKKIQLGFQILIENHGQKPFLQEAVILFFPFRAVLLEGFSGNLTPPPRV